MFKHKIRQGLAAVFALSLMACSSGEHSDVGVDEISEASLAAKFSDWERFELVDPETQERYPSYRIYGSSETWPDEAFEFWTDCGSQEYGFNSVILWPTTMQSEEVRQVFITYNFDSDARQSGQFFIGYDDNHIYFLSGDAFLAATSADSLHMTVRDPFKNEPVVVDFKMPKTRPFLNGFLEECDEITKANDALREKYEAQSE